MSARCLAVIMTLSLGVVPALAADAPAPPSLFAGRDTSVKPGDDFFRYANGQWDDSTPIPADLSDIGTGRELTELTSRQIRELIGDLAAHPPAPGSEARKVADYYQAYMDEAGIEARGLAPLGPELAAIAAIHSREQLARYLGTTLRADVDLENNTQMHTDHLFGLWVAADMDQPTRYVGFLVQGGLGMPDREYYLNDTASMRALQAGYQAHVARMLQLLGDSPAAAGAAAARVYALEHALAGVHVSRQESEDVQRGHNHWSRAELASAAPGLDWNAFFAGARLSSQPEFVIWQPSAVQGIAALVASTPIATWKDLLRAHLADDYAGVLPRAFVKERFAFYGTQLSGTPQIRERWQRAMASTNNALGEAVGKLYVARYFPPETQRQIKQLVTNLIAAFAQCIDALDWMAPETRTRAKAKLATLKVGVGYPDHWRDYSGLTVAANDAFGNAVRAQRFEYQRNLNKFGHVVDRSEWVMWPQEVNAVNLPVMNALNFPAANLQSPNFDVQHPASMNYAAIGATIGHEISHSFDDQGAQFDATGRLHNWWQPADYEHFRQAGAKLAAQFDTYRPFPDLAVNGKQTLSENIADLAGLTAAYTAFHLSLQQQPPAEVDGLNADQQFFLAFAQSWRGKYRDGLLRQLLLSDGHAPDNYRAATVRNLDAWYAAFDVQPGDALYLAPADRVRIWE